jgi:hypothetical protein
LNPADTIKKGGRAQLGAPLLLQLGRSGFRDMAVWNGQYLILAGDHKDRFASGAGSSVLFSWTGSGDPKPLNVDLGDLNPEAIVVMGEGTAAGARVLILSDDGKFAKQARNSFRGVWLQPAKPWTGPTPH